MLRQLSRFLSRISFRLMAFNLLLVFLPVAGILYLDTYEEHLVDSQRRALTSKAEALAAALALAPAIDARSLVTAAGNQGGARVRVVGTGGEVIADSSTNVPLPYEATNAERNFLYRLGSSITRPLVRLVRRPEPLAPAEEVEGGELGKTTLVAAALSGRPKFEKRVRNVDPPTVILYYATPIGGGTARGAVIASESTARILADLRDVRLGVFRIFIISVLLAMIISYLVSKTIVRPLRQLRMEAHELLDRRGRLRAPFRGLQKRDEIGDLSRALELLTRRLDAHLRFLDSFASDMSHEFKNPLASIRTATEMLSEVERREDRARFRRLIEESIARMEHLLRGLRELTTIDSQLALEHNERVALAEIVSGVSELFRLREKGRIRIDVEVVKDSIVHVAPERLAQALENLIANAVSFTPAGGRVSITVDQNGGDAVVTIDDEGSGIPEEHLERIFDRFFSWSPSTRAHESHTGLGLPIATAIAEGYGGEIRASNRPSKGARFQLTIPTAA